MVQGFVFVSLIPILVLIISLLFFKVKLAKSAILSLILTIILALGVWNMMPTVFGSALLKGLFVTVDVILVIFGALYFMQYSQRTGKFKVIEHLLAKIHPSKRVQTIILSFFFVAFIEGIAGFGTPAAVVVPLLVAFGMRPVYAIAIALVGDTVPVIFGAVGTPIRTGFSGIAYTTPYVAAWLCVPLLFLIPLVMLYLIKKSGLTGTSTDVPYRKLIPFALFCSTVYASAFVFFSYFIPELASVLSPIFGIGMVWLFAKQGWLLHQPKHVRKEFTRSQIVSALLPYIIFILILIVSKFFPFSITVLFRQGISHTFSLFNPGIVFLCTILITKLTYREVFAVTEIAGFVVRKIRNPFFILLSLGIMVQLFIHTGKNYSQLASMGEIMATLLQNNGLLVLSPFVGVLGAFLSGSATVSNLLFGVLQYDAAIVVGLSTILVLSLQLVGAALGNMIAISNIVAAQSVIGEEHLERTVLLLTVPICVLFVFVLLLTTVFAQLFGFL